MNKNLVNHLRSISQFSLQFQRISINSNGTLMSLEFADLLLDSPVNFITFSLNATNRESYRSLMGKDFFDKVVSNIKAFIERRSLHKRQDLKVSIQYMSSKLNDEKEINQIFNDYISKDIIVYNRYIFNKPSLSAEDFSNRKVDINQTNSLKRYPCWSMYSRVYVDIDGNVYPCTMGNDCYRANSNLNIGNVSEKSIVDIFKDCKISKIRECSEKNQALPSECNSCTLWSLLPNNFELNETIWLYNSTEELRKKELDRRN
ncbi:MAG: radical SAM protein [Oligoflexia bacterium]|nr:radical SAM protein [Oligoflexia bacterium]